MAELNNLIGSRITLVSQNDTRYEGILFAINSKEASIVLKDVNCMGTEDRVQDKSKQVPPSKQIVPFVSFPGQEIKDLFVHEVNPEPAPPAAPASSLSTSSNATTTPLQSQATAAVPVATPVTAQPANTSENSKPQAENQSSSNKYNSPRAGRGGGRGGGTSAVGTGEHLLKMWEKRSGPKGPEKPEVTAEFDITGALAGFDKATVLAEVASSSIGGSVVEAAKYSKNDFFDNLSCDLSEGRQQRLNYQQERQLNQDTFGAIALQSNYGNYHRNYRGGRGGGRGGNQTAAAYRGRGNYQGRERNPQGRGYQGRGRGRHNNSDGANKTEA